MEGWIGFSLKRLFIEAVFHRSGFSSQRLFIAAAVHRSGLYWNLWKVAPKSGTCCFCNNFWSSRARKILLTILESWWNSPCLIVHSMKRCYRWKAAFSIKGAFDEWHPSMYIRWKATSMKSCFDEKPLHPVKSYWRGRLSAVDLLVLTSLDQLIFILKIFLTFLTKQATLIRKSTMLSQGILKGEVSLYCWPPVWLVWNQLYHYWQFLFLFAKQTNPNQSNRRLIVHWYFPF
jgi:hypothetical protein